jgi:hypothetical protein
MDRVLYSVLSEAHEISARSRLVQKIRLNDNASHAGVLSKVWDFSIEEKEAEFRDDLRAASGIGRKRKKVTPTVFKFCGSSSILHFRELVA